MLEWRTEVDWHCIYCNFYVVFADLEDTFNGQNNMMLIWPIRIKNEYSYWYDGAAKTNTDWVIIVSQQCLLFLIQNQIMYLSRTSGLFRMGMGSGVSFCSDENTAGLAFSRSLYKFALFSRENKILFYWLFDAE